MLSLPSLFPTNANAEGYIAFQLGANVPSDLSSVKVTQSGATVATLSNLELKTSFLYGGKAGYYFSGLNWLGVETEVYRSNPDIKQQTFTQTPPGASFPFPKSDVRVTTWAFNLLARYPGESFQPYAGAGLGLFFSKVTIPGVGLKSDNWRPGLNVLAGTKYFLTKNIALFGEYKFNHASLSFDATKAPNEALQANYNAHLLAFGVGYHF